MTSTVDSPGQVDAAIAFVGGGPQALRALSALHVALEAAGAPAVLDVVVVDDADPGPGVVWAVDQPHHLRMNVSPAIVDLRSSAVPWDLRDWHVAAFGAPIDEVPPRALVGRYLATVWRRLASSPHLAVRHVRGRVERVEPVDRVDGVSRGRWRCRVTGGADVVARDVVLCTGHRDGIGMDHAALTDPDRGVPPGSDVAIEGAALTAFDAVMSLTWGRGGRWERDGDDPDALRSVASGLEPRRITLHSRSGERMLPKPVAPAPASDRAIADGLARRYASAAPLADAWWTTLIDTAIALAAESDVTVSAADLRRRLDAPRPTHDIAVEWRRDLGRARGDADADPAWWLGRAWSLGYAAVVASLDRLPRERGPWTRFGARAARLERWAFGPPAVVIARLLALHADGRLRVTTDAPDDRFDGVDGVRVRAHVPGPGVLPRPRGWDPRDHAQPVDPLWASLLGAGHVVVRRGEPGILTTPDATCLGSDGRPSAGLHALGRPTEGPVIGHDSLQTALHPDATRWAATVVAALAPDPLENGRP